ncbi:MAG: hypothetical protein E7265_01035 [Lachnospiraceae bacterium]|nr:hypothetical protein [Lachnospiraceae bacterium]
MSNKRIKVICIVGIVVCVILILVLLIFSTVFFEKERAENNKSVNVRQTVEPTEQVDNEIIKQDTILTLQKLHLNDELGENLVEERILVPAEFIAMDYFELKEYVDEYMQDIPIDESLEGLVSYDVISFDSKEVVMRKTYSNNMAEDKYYICDKDNEVVVYYNDMNTVYEYTGIELDSLSNDEQIRIRLGFYVPDEASLYALLEGYSS